MNCLLQTCNFFSSQDLNWWTGVVRTTCKSEVTYCQVWWPILGICALHLTHPKCTHTTVNTHTPWTHTRSSGKQFGVRYLAQGHLVVVLRVERLKLVTFRLWVWLSTIRAHDPLALWIIVVFFFFFQQLLGLSFWRHPFTAEKDPALSK